MRSPAKRMRPEVGLRKPVTMLNSVVLPAPFGPMRPVMVPLRTCSEHSLTARRPSKLFVTACTSSSAPFVG